MIEVVSTPVVRTAARRTPATLRCRDDLPGRVRLAVRMARRTVEVAIAATTATPQEEGTRRPPPLVVGKVVGEAAMLLRAVTFLRGDDAELDAEAQALAEALIPHARGDRVIERLCNDAGRALEHASAHLFLADAGYRDDDFARLLDGIVAGNAERGTERLPNHQLELEWLDQIRDRSVDAMRAGEALLAETCLGWPLDVLGCSTIDLYLLTHAVMYASDMGRRAVWLPRPTGEVLRDVEAALAAALDADNFDLAAELLWTWPMLRQAWSPTASFAFDVLARAQDEHGFLPGPDHARWAGDRAHGLSDEDLRLRTSYHANVVMGILCAAALHPRSAPAPMAPMNADDPGRARLLGRLPRRPFVPRWQGAFEALDERRQSALSSLCLDVWFRRATASNDFAQLREALGVAADIDDGEACEGPSARQALTRLRRAMAAARLRDAPGLPH